MSSDGDLRVSYSAGADALNVGTILKCGAAPVTACSDLLKPGGYARFGQWLTNLEAEMEAAGAGSLAEFSRNKLDEPGRSRGTSRSSSIATRKRRSPTACRRSRTTWPSSTACRRRASRTARCARTCPSTRGRSRKGNYDQALEVILARNPLPAVTGYVCNHLCQTALHAERLRGDHRHPRAEAVRGGARQGRAARRQGVGRQEGGHRRLRALRLLGRVLPRAQRRRRAHVRGQGRHRRHDAAGAGLPPAVGSHPARRGPHPGPGRDARAGAPGRRGAGGAARRGLRRGVRGDRLPEGHAAEHPGRQGSEEGRLSPR